MPKTKQTAENTEKPQKDTTHKTTGLTMEDLMKKQSMKPPKKGQEIQAKIVTLGKRQIIFDIGWKSYAVLGELETRELSTYLPYLKEGDSMSATVVVEESKEGFPVLSMRKFFEKGKWDILEKKQKDEEIIEVVCGEYGKGGIFIDFMGIRGVIPKIQLTEDFIVSPDKLYGQKIKVKVLEVDKAKNRLVVSQKAVALGISYKDLKHDFDAIKIGDVYKAKVIGFSDFGVFCEVNKIEGLIHISEISWSKVSDPTRNIKVDDELDVVVVEKNETNYKLNLSIKRLTPDPWGEIAKKYPHDKEFEGEIIRKERYGYIVRLEPGIEGLIHISKVSAGDDLSIGKKVRVYVEKVDMDNRRMSLVMQESAKPVAYR
ncbi:MAG TPA: S1 RNA-binding domain-containing protein [Candidatus Nitrosocosmicus sp.]|nr:S1 RNA-binding domain-containing protein [Candidatus Nitrosocosmicus sp.]